MAGRMNFHQKSRYHLNKLFTLRKARAGAGEIHKEYRDWLSSIAVLMTNQELEGIFCYIYSTEERLDTDILDGITQPLLVGITSRPTGLKFKDRTP